MSFTQALLTMALSVMGVAQATSPREYTPEELPQLVADFELEHALFDAAGVPITSDVVDAVVRIRVSAPDSVTAAHDLVVYVDNRFVGSQAGATFPFVLLWNFKGLLEGPHSMMLVFTSHQDKKGLVNLALTVEH